MEVDRNTAQGQQECFAALYSDATQEDGVQEKSCTKLGQLAEFKPHALLMSSTGQQWGMPKLYLGYG